MPKIDYRLSVDEPTSLKDKFLPAIATLTFISLTKLKQVSFSCKHVNVF